MDYLIRNANVVNEGETFVADVLISRGVISRIGRGCAPDAAGARIIDASGRYLIPGIIDEHVHFREPGLTHKADIFTESRAAVAGGVTSFMDMPNTAPPATSLELLEQKFELASQKSLANYSFYIGATDDNLQELLRTDFRGVCGIKLFMGSSTGNMLVDSAEAIEALLREAPCLIAAHCEDEETIRRQTAVYRAMAAAPDASVHPLIRSREACYKSSARAVELAEKTGARLHVLHISTEEELSLFRSDIPLEQKKITAETCPHYLHFTDADYATRGFAIKCNPAVKSRRDRDALLSALRSGVIDTVGTDHAPHLRDEKFTGDYFGARSGFPSVQHGLQVLLSEGVSLVDAVRLMCHNPASLYRIERRGYVREGYHADLAIIDTSLSETVSAAGEFSKCGWSPYEGERLASRITHTFVNGNLVFEHGVFHDDSRGERLEFRTP